MSDKITVDLSMEVRDALATTLQQANRPIGFFVQPGIIASTSDEPALRNLVRELVGAITMTPTASSSPLFVFDTLESDATPFYAISLLGQGDLPASPIAPRVDAAANALDAVVWDVPPVEGETAVVCFALEGDERVPA
jgi:hypothetical protein